MHKPILAALFVLTLLYLPVAAEGKTVVYITAADTESPCSSLKNPDKDFCNRLSGLNYTITVLNEQQVVAGTSIANSYLSSADMVFVGTTSTDLSNSSKSQRNFFCNNITSQKKPAFLTMGSVTVNKTVGIEGCFIDYSPFPHKSNSCLKKSLKVEKDGYVTKGLGKIMEAYTKDGRIRIALGTDSPDISWLTAECSNPDIPVAFYDVVSSKKTGKGRLLFWGLEEASLYTNSTWELFDRAVIYTMDDQLLKIEVSTFPSNPTAGKEFWLLLKARDRFGNAVKAGKFSLPLAGTETLLSYDSIIGSWALKGIKLTKNETLNITAGDTTFLYNVTVGNIKVDILTSSYRPGSITITANSSYPAELSYRILLENLTQVGSGRLAYYNSLYRSEYELRNYGDVYLEVTALNSTETGGEYRKITAVSPFSEKDYSIEPAEWIIPLRSGTVSTQSFSIKNRGNKSITNLNLTVSGALAGRVSFSLPPREILPKETGTFTATLNSTGLEDGDYYADFSFSADQFSKTIPVTLSLWNITGIWIDVEPKEWKSPISTKESLAKTFTLRNRAPLILGELSVKGKGELEGIVSAVQVPSYILGKNSSTIKLSADGTKLKSGVYKGDIEISSNLGTATISAVLEVQDISENITSLFSELETLKLTASSRGLTSLYENVNNTLSSADSNLREGNAEAALSDLESAKSQLEQLKSELQKPPPPPPFPWDTVVIVLVVIAAIALLVYFFKLRKHKPAEKKEEKKSEETVFLPEKEDTYRSEYY